MIANTDQLLRSLSTTLAVSSMAFLLFGFSHQQAQAEQVDGLLVQALQQATRDIHQQTTDLDSLLWLSSMSERLAVRIPDPFYRIRLLKAVRAEATRAALDPQLVLAIIDIESNFNRHALSRAGAQGLMQVMPFWKKVQGTADDDLYNPLVSLRYGCTILRHYLDKHEKPSDALAAYNGSLGRSSAYSDKVESSLKNNWHYQADKFSKEGTKLAAR